MTDYENAEKLRKQYLSDATKHKAKNICRAKPNWNGCDYCDVYAGNGEECWNQKSELTCCYCERIVVSWR